MVAAGPLPVNEGLVSDLQDFFVKRGKLGSGEILLLYTDDIVEAQGAAAFSAKSR